MSDNNCEVTEMKRNILFTVCAIGFYANAMAGTSHADNWYGGLGLGAYFNHSYSQSVPSVNATLGYDISKNLAAQLKANYLSSNQGAIMAEGIWNFNNHSAFIPYAAAGFGFMHLRPKSNTIGLDAGAGVKYELTPGAYLSADYRYLQSFGSHTPSGSVFSIGFSVYFGAVNQDLSHALSPERAQRESYYHATYALPKNIMECQQDTSATTLQSVGCYTVEGDEVIMHLDAKFDYDSYALTDEARTAIDPLSQFIKAHDIKQIVLKGYASRGKTGPAYARYNQKLSEQRAKSVKSYLVSQGVSGNDITVIGYGYNDPLVSNATQQGRAINQRVETNVPAPLQEK